MLINFVKKCKSCNNEFERIGQHWNYKPSHREKFTDKQLSVITGILMGDGTLCRDSKNAKLQIEMTNKKYLEHISSTLENLANTVNLKNTAKQNAQHSKRTGFNKDAIEENYQSTFVLQTVHHPQLNKYRSWYKKEKVWPKEINMSPKTLKNWYVCDGTYQKHGSLNRIAIEASNEHNNESKIIKYFQNSNLPKPSNIYKSKRKNKSGYHFTIYFNVEDSKKLFKYMGSAPPGFEYKWPQHI